jgi:hypothetical protein
LSWGKRIKISLFRAHVLVLSFVFFCHISPSREDADLIQADFKSYLQIQVRIVGEDKKIARGHFRMAQIEVEP